MKRAGILLLTVLFLFNDTEFHEVLKVPLLITHFIEHKNEDPALTLSIFLKEHYSKNTGESDSVHHTQLPFHAAEHVASNVVMFLSHFTLHVPTPYFDKATTLAVYLPSFVSFQLLANIWQPPKC